MKRYYSSIVIIATVVLTSLFLNGCNDSQISEPQTENSTVTLRFMKIAESSPSVSSFSGSYDEGEAMSIAGSLAKELYPIRVGQKMKLVDKNMTLVKDSTSAIGTLVQTFEGKLIIQGSFQPVADGSHMKPDTTVEKDFTSVITREIKFLKVNNTGNDTLDWKVDAVSLPNGGTADDDIQIVKLTLSTQDGDTVAITNPNEYFFKTGESGKDDDDNHAFSAELGKSDHGWKNLLTWYRKNQPVTLSVEVLSKYADRDFLTVTNCAAMNSNDKSKERLDLVSSVQEGDYYRKVYERKWYTRSYAVRMHAVVNAVPGRVVYFSDTNVSEKTWGIPYRVK